MGQIQLPMFVFDNQRFSFWHVFDLASIHLRLGRSLRVWLPTSFISLVIRLNVQFLDLSMHGKMF
jgi:hypothetical protein